MTDVPIDRAALDRLLDNTGGDVDFVSELVDQFLANTPGLVAAARAGIELEDADEVRRAAHTLKSNAATFGATSLAERSRTLEEAARGGSLAGTSTQIDELESELARVHAALPAIWSERFKA